MMTLVRFSMGIFILYMMAVFAGIVESPYFSRMWKEPKWESMTALPDPVSIADALVHIEENPAPQKLEHVTDNPAYFVVFYGDWCGVCRKKMPFFLNRAAEFEAAGAPLLLVGDRRSVKGAWKRWAHSDTDLSDINAVIDTAGIIFGDLNINAVPSYGLLNGDNKLTASFRFVNPHAGDLVTSVQSLAELIE